MNKGFENTLYESHPHNVNMWKVEVEALICLPKMETILVIVDYNSDIKVRVSELMQFLFSGENCVHCFRMSHSAVSVKAFKEAPTIFDFMSPQSGTMSFRGREYDAVLDMTRDRKFVYYDDGHPAINDILGTIKNNNYEPGFDTKSAFNVTGTDAGSRVC